LICKAEVLCT